MELPLQRIAFLLQIKADRLQEYDLAHQAVWPELIDELRSFGVADYSIFRRGQQLFLYLRVQDFELLKRQLAASEINQRWQRQMAPLFEPVPGDTSGGYALMQEVFHMRGAASSPLEPPPL